MASDPLNLLFKETGEHDGYRLFKLLVGVLVNQGGKVWSTHDFQTPEDAQLAGQLAGGGVRHIAHALLVEALRREVYAGIMAKLTHDPTYLQGYQQGDATTRAQIELELAQCSRQVMLDTTGKIGLDVAREILVMVGKPS